MTKARRGWREWLQHAFSLNPDYAPLTEEEETLLERVARAIVKRKMEAPAILLLESIKPLNYIGSQAMAFLEPIVRGLTTAQEYTTFRQILERRQGLEVLLQKIEAVSHPSAETPAATSDEEQTPQASTDEGTNPQPPKSQ